jgi:CubicO group peptidase (beta-lactamase class C family)
VRPVALLPALVWIVCSGAAAGITPSGTTFVRDALSRYVDSGELPGAVSVLEKNGVREVACLGYSDVARKRPVTMDDVFRQCSQTKGFCGVTVAKLIEEGRLGLDDPVSRYLPEFGTLWVKAGETNGTMVLRKAKNALTVRMCLNHTGGIPFEVAGKHYRIPGGGWSGGMRVRIAAATAAAAPLLYEPGEKGNYSNTGTDIAAAVVETIAGMRWEKYLQKTVLDPLGMKNTGFYPTDEQLKTRMMVYKCRKGARAEYQYSTGNMQRPFNGDNIFPSAGAGLWTTVNDQLKFYRMLMNLGLGDNGVRILKEETVKSLLAVSQRKEGMGGYSLGFTAPEKDGEDRWFGHGGALGTYCYVNWHRRELKLWAVQLVGSPRPWDAELNAASNAFFARTLDNSSADTYADRGNWGRKAEKAGSKRRDGEKEDE